MELGQKRRSIRWRLVIQLSIIAAVMSLAFFLAVRAVAEQAAADTQDDILAASATSIADALYSERGEVRLELPYSALSMLGTISEDQVFYRIVANDVTLTGYDDLAIPAAQDHSRTPVFSTTTYRGAEVRTVAMSRAVSTGNLAQDVTVVVAQTRLGLAATSSRITSSATAVAVGFFLVATLLSLFAAQSAVTPLNRLTKSVTRRGPNDLRPVVSEIPSELVPLVDALNGFLARLRASLTRSEEFIVEAAHRIRTPLATVRTQAEVVYRQMEKPKNKRSVREMIRAVDESSRSAGQLLEHAMVSLRTDQLDTQEIDLVDLMGDICERVRPTCDLKDIHLNLDLCAQPAKILGDPILLQSAVHNILDNAIKYSPADSTITLSLEKGDSYRMTFSDQGRGFGGADPANLVHRFTRGANVSDIIGSGLGLTIADEVVRAHNGYLEIKQNKEGIGACVSLVLPVS